jgi:hypothetical protein
MDGGECKSIVKEHEHCNDVDSTGACRRCDLYYHDENGECVKNEDKHCLKRSISSTNDKGYYCSICEPGYGYDYGKLKCRKCSGDCNDCDFLLGVETCYECTNGFQLDTDGKCQAACSTGCELCMEHDITFYDQKDYGNCVKCSEGYALYPAESHYLYGYGTLAGECHQIANCEIAYTTSSCLQCKEGFVNNGGDCITPIEHCTDYYYDDTCQYCEQGYGTNEDDTQCKKCTDEHCLACAFDGEVEACGRCEDGYYVDTDEKTCSKCNVENCANCQISYTAYPDICYECNAGYTVKTTTADDGTTTYSCESCGVENCASCSAVGTCTICNAGYTANADGSACVANPAPIENCMIDNADGTECDTPAPGYAVATDGKSCVACTEENCSACASDGENCAVCYNNVNDLQDTYTSDDIIDALARKVLNQTTYYNSDGKCKEMGSGSISVMVAMILIALLF